jgi:hypothetical protein
MKPILNLFHAEKGSKKWVAVALLLLLLLLLVLSLQWCKAYI